MSRIAAAIATARERGETAIIPYLTAGYPDPAESVDLVAALAAGGADVIEFGVPFSDPMGDGLVIQRSSEVALAAGMTVARVLDQVAEVRSAGITVPIALMGYANPFLRYGVKRLLADAASAGVDGLIVPDLPPDAEGFASSWIDSSTEAGIDPIFFASPDSDQNRLASAGAATRGFLYCLAVNGVTGIRAELDRGLPDYLSRVRAATTAPLAVGFGISVPAHVAALHGLADAAIVGSALLRRIGAAPSAAARRVAAQDFVAGLKDGSRGTP